MAYKLTVQYWINGIDVQRVEHVVFHQQESKRSCVGPEQGHNDKLTSAKILLGYLYALSGDECDGTVVLGLNSNFKALSSLRFSTNCFNLSQNAPIWLHPVQKQDRLSAQLVAPNQGATPLSPSFWSHTSKPTADVPRSCHSMILPSNQRNIW